jgi:hypothetical protein
MAAAQQLQKQQRMRPFKRWRPGLVCAVRHYLLSDNFQSGLQLAVGITFVSLFVFIE